MGYYNSIANGYEELYREEQLNKLDIIKNNIKINKNTKILDVGCGTGISSDFDCFVVGVDPSMGLLNQNKYPMKLLGTAEALPFRSNEFDYVISITALHNFQNIKKSIDEAKRVGRHNFIFSILRKSGKYSQIKNLIEKSFKICNVIEEGKDTIFLCRKL